MGLNRLAKPVLHLPRPLKRILAIFLDAFLCALTVWLAFYLRLGQWIDLSGNFEWDPAPALIVSLVMALPIFIIFGLYRAIFRYSGWTALMAVAKAAFVYGILYFSIFTVYGVPGVPRTLGLIQPILLLLAVGASRAFVSYWLGGLYQNIFVRASLPKTLIYGAGTAGRQLAAALLHSQEMSVIGFLDDNEKIQGQTLNNLPIYAPNDLSRLVQSHNVHRVLLAIPSASRKRRNEVLNLILNEKLLVQTVPSMSDLAKGKVTTSDLHWLDIDDLLGRDPVAPNAQLLDKNIANSVVMVTGAGGSIGSELTRQMFALQPKVLLLVEQSEFALYQLHEELLGKQKNSSKLSFEIFPLIASVCDERRMNEIISTWNPDTIFHAAAYKHVPLVEHNPAEGIRNNVLGTLVTAQCAIKHHVKNFVLISTDKAVRPTNIMGATKRLAENVLQALAATSQSTIFTMVRFGNVLDSSGSVVPKFRQQILDGGPITVTDAEITRYFMTIPEAAQLVIQAGAMGTGGDVFVLDMGEPVRIMDLAKKIIELSGLSVRDESNQAGDIEIEVTGLRPGEKLYEELLIGDNPEPTSHPRIMKAHEDFVEWPSLSEKLAELKEALAIGDSSVLRDLLGALVPGYKPQGGVVDWVFLNESKTSSIS
jgi:FlaA1/EpsC-like NDP-sugar epimerase